MSTPTYLPTSFDAFKNKKKRIKNIEAKGLLNRFAYRYRLARSFKSMDAPEVGKTLLGYDAILKVFLAYTAYEEIVTAAHKLNVNGVHHIGLNVRSNIGLADRFRKNEKLKKFLIAYSKAELGGKLELMFTKKFNDIVCVAFALRSIFAHGDLTPTAIGVTTKVERDLLVDLANDLLDYSDEVFSKCMNYT